VAGRDEQQPRRGRLERWLLSIMGPPSVGDVHAPLTYTPDPSALLCDKCGRPYDEHGRVYGNVTYLTCPR
jgi:hypothetical protein